MQESPIENDEKKLIRLLRLDSERDANALRNVCDDFFMVKNGRLFHPRIEIELADYRKKSDKARESARARWEKENETKQEDTSSKDANAMRTHSEGNANHKPITNNHKPINPKKKASGKKDEDGFIRPSWINQALWEDFILIRKKLKAVNSDGALKALVTKLEKMAHAGNDPNEVIAQSIENSWKGVFELRGNKNGSHQQDTRSRAQRVSDELDRIAREDIEKNGYTGTLG